MKKLIIFLAVFAAGLYLWSSYLDSPGVIIRGLPSRAGQDKLTFNMIYAGVVPLGEMTVENLGLSDFSAGSKAYHLKAWIQPNRLMNFFYKANAQAESFVDKDKLYPLMFKYIFTVSGITKEKKTFFYDQVKCLMREEDSFVDGKEAPVEDGGSKRVIYPGTYDPISLVFYIVNQPLNTGKNFDLNLNTNQKNYQVKAQVQEKREINFRGRIFEFYLVKGSVKRRDGNPRHSSRFSLLVLTKPFKKPLVIKSFTNLGPLEARCAD